MFWCRSRERSSYHIRDGQHIPRCYLGWPCWGQANSDLTESVPVDFQLHLAYCCLHLFQQDITWPHRLLCSPALPASCSLHTALTHTESFVIDDSYELPAFGQQRFTSDPCLASSNFMQQWRELPFCCAHWCSTKPCWGRLPAFLALYPTLPWLCSASVAAPPQLRCSLRDAAGWSFQPKPFRDSPDR